MSRYRIKKFVKADEFQAQYKRLWVWWPIGAKTDWLSLAVNDIKVHQYKHRPKPKELYEYSYDEGREWL